MTALLSPARARSRFPVRVGLVAVTAACWAYLLLLSARMGDMGSPLAMPMTSDWTGQDAGLMWLMWAVMMAGMMLPSAAPMIGAYSTSVRSQAGRPGSTSQFVMGYLAAWSGFALVATGAQWLLHDRTLVDAMGSSTSRWLGGLLLIGAGVYQFSDLKNACLAKCRTPIGFLLANWRAGRGGALVMGLHHGTICIGCCWALMALLFVLGVMNLVWIALVAAVVLLEKLVPSDALSRLLGVTMFVWGVVLIATA